MGLLRSLAKNVVGRVLGRDEAPQPARPASPKSAPAQAVERSTAAATSATEPSADAESLARIECGAQELKERLDAGETVVTVDVREPAETSGGVIPGARLIPLREIYTRWEELKDANEIVCYCAGGGRSLEAATFLRQKGLFNATSMEGGFFAWRQIGGQVGRPG